MKAKAPEKIYVYIPNDDIVGTASTQKGFPHQFVTEEYTRTDAFIDKACEWLSDNLQTIVDIECPSKHHVESIHVLGSITQTEFLSKFRKEIKYLFD